MWGDLILLPMANAAIAPYLPGGRWLVFSGLIGLATTWWLHHHWHRGEGETCWREHLWPARRHGRWQWDLSWAGWLHVIYVAGEMTLLVAYAVAPMPVHVVLIVSVVLTLHVPLGLLTPAWVATGGQLVRNRLLWPALAIVWVVAVVKIFGQA